MSTPQCGYAPRSCGRHDVSILQAETQATSSCRHCEDDGADSGRLVSSCADREADRYCRWVVRFERTAAARAATAKTKDQIAVEDALGNFRLVQPVQVVGDEAQRSDNRKFCGFQSGLCEEGRDGWQIVKIMDAPESQSKLSLQQK